MLTYVACPHSHPNPEVREIRFKIATLITGYLIKQGEMAFSPITHSHPIFDMSPHCQDMDSWKHWAELDTMFLRMSKSVVVINIPGHLESVGVNAELRLAAALRIPVRNVFPLNIIRQKPGSADIQSQHYCLGLCIRHNMLIKQELGKDRHE